MSVSFKRYLKEREMLINLLCRLSSALSPQRKKQLQTSRIWESEYHTSWVSPCNIWFSIFPPILVFFGKTNYIKNQESIYSLVKNGLKRFLFSPHICKFKSRVTENLIFVPPPPPPYFKIIGKAIYFFKVSSHRKYEQF